MHWPAALILWKNSWVYRPLSLGKIPSGANAFEISDIQEDETEAALTRRSECNNVTLG
jgi:hypothetical protein